MDLSIVNTHKNFKLKKKMVLLSGYEIDVDL